MGGEFKNDRRHVIVSAVNAGRLYYMTWNMEGSLTRHNSRVPNEFGTTIGEVAPDPKSLGTREL